MYDQDKQVQQKIQQLNEMPDCVAFNASAAWTTLEEQLQPRSGKKTGWYSIAAIFILVFTGVILFYFVTNTSTSYPISNTKIENSGIKPTITSKAKEQSFPIENKIVTTVKPIKATVSTSQETIAKENTPIVTSPAENIFVNEPIVTVTQIEQQPIIATPPLVTTTTTVVKKPKLRVVHLNDLYQPDPVLIAKAETKKQETKEDIQESEPINTTPPKTIWKLKPQPRISISLTDNQ